MTLETLLRRGRRIRTLGVDDGPFLRGGHADVLVVGAVYSAAQFEGLLSTKVRPDGFNSTDRLIRMIVGSKFHRQLHLLLLDGITLGGFNIVNLPDLAEATGIPAVAVTRRRPDLAAVASALNNLSITYSYTWGFISSIFVSITVTELSLSSETLFRDNCFVP